MTDQRFAFLVGNGRSGSSLVHELLARHGDIGFLSNLEDRIPLLPAAAGRYNNLLYRSVPVGLTRKGRLRYAPSEGYRVLARRVSPMIADSVRDLVASDAMPWVAKRFTTFFCERAGAQGKNVFVHKFTGWPRAGFVQAIFPKARFIHIVRDGRAVVASALQLSWWQGYRGPNYLHAGPLAPAYAEEWEASGRSFALLAGLSWKTNMDAYAAARESVPSSQWLDVHFEDLVTDPEPHFETMLDFMGLVPDESFRSALAGMKFDVGRRDAFREELDARSIDLLESSLAGHLRYWGYE